jgi:hypothetical protein
MEAESARTGQKLFSNTLRQPPRSLASRAPLASSIGGTVMYTLKCAVGIAVDGLLFSRGKRSVLRDDSRALGP